MVAISGGDWLIGGSTILLVVATAAVALIGLVQLRGLRDESRRQRTIDSWVHYESNPFTKARLAALSTMEKANAAKVSLRTASELLTVQERLRLDQYLNNFEWLGQQYARGLLDKQLLQVGLGYIAWYWWPTWKPYVHARRAEAGDDPRVFEYWENLYNALNEVYPTGEREAAQAAVEEVHAAVEQAQAAGEEAQAAGEEGQ
jgi:hypothetical protein